MAYEPQEGIDYIVNLYSIAGTEPDANETDLRTALNRKAMEYYPDRLEGVAPEFREKGERMARLLNRARGILLDPDKRSEYDKILANWEGPVSEDGIPAMSLDRYHEIQMQGKSSEEVEAIFAEQVEKIASMTGYSPSRLVFLESMIEKAGGEISDELRAEYEDTLLQKDRALAIEEAELSRLLSLPDIESQNFVATLSYGEDMAGRLEAARESKEAQLQLQALGGVGAKLALLSGEETEPRTKIVVASPLALELPEYFDEQAAKVQAIAEEREAITDKRLENFRPILPEAKLQTELREDLIIGIVTGSMHTWFGAKLDIAKDSAEFQEVSDDLKQLLDRGDYEAVILRGNGLLLITPMEHIDIQDLIGVAIGKYTDKHKEQ
jgi:curved DNA-binding protein CbpA